MWEYTEKVFEHFKNPRNVGEVEDPDGVGDVGSLACGDALHLTFKLDENKRIKEAKFKTFGCASAIASSSALTEMIKGKSLEEAEKITNQDIADYLGGLPEEKMHCSVMGKEALDAAIAYYRGETIPEDTEDVVCKCFGISGKEIREVAQLNGLKTVEQVTHYTKAGGGCSTCHPEIQQILREIAEEEEEKAKQARATQPRKKLTNLQKIKLIEETMDREIRPSLKQDGGDIELVDVEGDKVLVGFRGTCSSCPSSEFTLKGYVQEKLREFVSPEIEVEEMTP
jgi:NifU-like protein